MRHRIAGRSLGRTTGHRMAMLRNLTRDLLYREYIITTEAKAKETRSFAERTITLGKDGSLAARRRVLRFVSDQKVVKKVFGDLAIRYTDRPGGYTRMTKLGPRAGDAAPMVRIELL